MVDREQNLDRDQVIQKFEIEEIMAGKNEDLGDISKLEIVKAVSRPPAGNTKKKAVTYRAKDLQGMDLPAVLSMLRQDYYKNFIEEPSLKRFSCFIDFSNQKRIQFDKGIFELVEEADEEEEEEEE